MTSVFISTFPESFLPPPDKLSEIDQLLPVRQALKYVIVREK